VGSNPTLSAKQGVGDVMDTRILGRTGLQVTRIGLGLAAIGRPGYINLGRDVDLGAERGVATLRGRAHELLDAAWASGVRYVDAARSYGLAESFLASWLDARQTRPDEIVVGSKWGYTYTAAWVIGAEVNEVKDHTLPTLRRQLGESRALLGPWLRLYQIHSATLESGVLRDTAVLAELAAQRGEGLAIGFSVSGARQGETIRAALDVRVDGVCPFDAVQATWNVLEPSVGSALEEAHGAGLGVLVKEALANGRLVVDAGRAEPERALALAALDRIAEQRAASGPAPIAFARDAVALAAVLAQPWADVVLSGAVTPLQLRSNLAALDLGLRADDLDELAALAVPASTYWRERSALAWS
jgi:aryl-alcohol dehydrogenase-like predicted oxidoreductase